jgi:hypothetical protein
MVTLALGACLAGASSRDRLMEALSDYNDAVRWGQIRAATGYLRPEARDAFVARQVGARADLQMADYELVQIDMSDDKRAAKVVVEVTWMLRSDGLMRQSALEQQWEEHDGRWSLVRERGAGGAPMPGAPPKQVTAATGERALP